MKLMRKLEVAEEKISKKSYDLDKFEVLAEKAYKLRHEMLEMCIKAGDGHVTSSLS